MPEPARADLRLVDPETGELHGTCPDCLSKDHVIAGLNTNVAGWASKYGRLNADKLAEHEGHKRRAEIEELHGYWQTACNHPTADLDFGKDSSFEAWLWALQFAERAFKKRGEDDPRGLANALVRRAVDGAGFDPFSKRTKNGRIERYDSPTTIFKNADSFRRFVLRAPRAA